MLLETVSCHNGSDIISGCKEVVTVTTSGATSDDNIHIMITQFLTVILDGNSPGVYDIKNINPNFDYSLLLHVFKCISNLPNWRAIWWHLFWKIYMNRFEWEWINFPAY